MVDEFNSILSSDNASPALKSLVVDALSSGAPLPDLASPVSAILLNKKLPLGQRYRAFSALRNMGHAGREHLIRAYRESLDSDSSSIQIKAEILSAMYSTAFSPSDVVHFLSAASECRGEFSGAWLWHLSEALPLTDIELVLDQYDPATQPELSYEDKPDYFEIAEFFDRILIRLLAGHITVSAAQLYSWLQKRHRLREFFGGTGSQEKIRTILRGKSEILKEVIDQAISSMGSDPWRYLFEFRELTLYAIDDSMMLDAPSVS